MKIITGIFLGLFLVFNASNAGETPYIRASLEGGLPPKNLVDNPGFESGISDSSATGNWLAYSHAELLARMSKPGAVQTVAKLRVDESGQFILPDAPVQTVRQIINPVTLEEYEAIKVEPAGRVTLKPRGKQPAKLPSLDDTIENAVADLEKAAAKAKNKGAGIRTDEVECEYTYLAKVRTGHGSIRTSSFNRDCGIWLQNIPSLAIPESTKKIYGQLYVCGANTANTVIQLTCRVKCKDGSSYQTPTASLSVKGDFDWQPMTIQFGDTREIDSFGIYIGASVAGTVWFDDVLFVPATTEISFAPGEEELRRAGIMEQFESDGVSVAFPFSAGEKPIEVLVDGQSCPVWKGGFNYLIDFENSTIRFNKAVTKGKTVSLVLAEVNNPAKDFVGSIKGAFTLHSYLMEIETRTGEKQKFDCPGKK